MALINATLVVQAFHFYIAFLMIKHLFFKPIFFHIEQENSLQETLINTVQKQQLRVAEKEQAIKDQWQQLRSYFVSESPHIKPTSIQKNKQDSIKVPVLSDTQIQKVISQTAESIIKKVGHVG